MPSTGFYISWKFYGQGYEVKGRFRNFRSVRSSFPTGCGSVELEESAGVAVNDWLIARRWEEIDGQVEAVRRATGTPGSVLVRDISLSMNI